MILVGRWQSGWDFTLHLHFPPHLTHVIALHC